MMKMMKRILQDSAEKIPMGKNQIEDEYHDNDEDDDDDDDKELMMIMNPAGLS